MWYTTKDGKHINTDWFDQDRQIEANKREADERNGTNGGTLKQIDENTWSINDHKIVRVKGVSKQEVVMSYYLRTKDDQYLGPESVVRLRGKDLNKEPVALDRLCEVSNNLTHNADDKSESGNKEKILSSQKDTDSIKALTRCNEQNLINPHYNEENSAYHENCALCTTAAVLQARGYDVEALPRDRDKWRGPQTVFDVDYENKDNYIIGNTTDSVEGLPHLRKTAQGHYRIMVVDNASTTPSVKYHTDVPVMPKGAKQVTAAVQDKVKGWGNGAVGELSVCWSNNRHWHSVVVFNQGGKVAIYDAQSNEVITDLPLFFKGTVASRTFLVRLDNAPLKKGAEVSLKYMVKNRKENQND